jgi:hypothetical protein
MVETGRVGIQQPDPEQLLHAVTGDTRAALPTLRRQARNRELRLQDWAMSGKAQRD